MMHTAPHSSLFYDTAVDGPGRMVLRFKGRMDVGTAADILADLQSLIATASPSGITADLERVTAFDDYGALLLVQLKKLLPDDANAFDIINSASQPAEILSQVHFEHLKRCRLPEKKKRPDPVLVRLGDSSISHFFSFRLMIAFIGSVMLAFLRAITHPKSLRMNDTISFMEKTGVDALPIVGLISFLLGFIIAFMSSIQLQQFGANIYVASLVALAMVSELGPIMTAIIVAGRTGSAFAAEIGTMKISEEVDALYSMGFDPTLFLVVPRMIASIIVVPILTLFSDIFAITGGLVIGVLMLKLSPIAYITQTINTLSLFEVLWGLLKSLVFSVLVSWIACLRGFQARGGAASVGNAATSAVVSSIFLIILFDSLFAVIRTYWR